MGKVLLFALLLLAASACSQTETVVYIGEGEHWSGVYTLEYSNGAGGASEETFSTEALDIRYKGEREELADVAEITYGYELTNSAWRRTYTFDGESTLDDRELSMSQTALGAGPDTDLETITVFMEWDDEEERFELERQ
ncbi:hypothetical protein [Alteribacter natronophilus]|uniref:hypothetical protein n=1 Tax=Alteribacter natronophilus TaxID=2583810 RepID=UPI00110D42FA|nr:hypothetical protein [Alteribacter natronophilus]TMW71381.1 hypothetical protein FGB90_10030 [Alteribacter natronophilus]